VFCPGLCVNAATARSNTCSCPRHFRADALLPLRCVPAPAPALGSRASPLARPASAPKPARSRATLRTPPVLAVRPCYWPSPPEPLRSTPRAATACASPPLARCLEPPPQRLACAPPGPTSRPAPCASIRPRVPCLGQLLIAHAPARAARTHTSLGAAAPAARARSPRCASSRSGPCPCRCSSTACSSPGPPAPTLPGPLPLARAAQRPSRSPCRAARRPASSHCCRPRPASAHCRRPRAPPGLGSCPAQRLLGLLLAHLPPLGSARLDPPERGAGLLA
jgi:hypothetical protein